jgi:hypothetical protein
MAIQEFRTSRNNKVVSVDYIGQDGRLWYDPITNTIRVYDGTPGGAVVTGGSSNSSPGGSNTQIQYNDAGIFGGSPDLVYDTNNTTLTANNITVTSSINLGDVSNVTIQGGSANYVLKTDGTGNLSWVAQTSGSANISVSNSNVELTSSVSSFNFVGNAVTATASGTDVTVTVSSIVAGGESNAIQINNDGELSGSSNLTFDGANMTVGGNIVPTANVTYNLGSADLRWNSIYLAGNTIDLGGAVIKTDATAGILLIPPVTNDNPSPTAVLINPAGKFIPIATSNGVANANAVANAATTQDSEFANVIVTGNLTANTGVITVGNVVIEGDRITSANSIITIDPAADGSTGTVIIEGNLTVRGTTTTIDSDTIVVAGNVEAADITASGTITANVFVGNGSQLTGISGSNSFGNITVANGNSVIANAPLSTVTFAAVGPANQNVGMQITATDSTLTFSLAQPNNYPWTDGSDFGEVVQLANNIENLGEVLEVVATQLNLGGVVLSGVIVPSKFVLPAFRINTLPGVTPAGQMVFVTDASGGAVPAYSDGTNWRSVVNGQIIE